MTTERAEQGGGEINRRKWVRRMGGEVVVSRLMNCMCASYRGKTRVLDVKVLRATEVVQWDHHLVFGKVRTQHMRSTPVQEEGMRQVLKFKRLEDKYYRDAEVGTAPLQRSGAPAPAPVPKMERHS